MIRSISTSEWLGPLAPIAISPFFGITCLALISQFGADYLPLNGFVLNNAALQSQAVLWIFLALTLLTSIPRFTKVSKPFAQAMDQLEAYAGVITIIVLRFMAVAPEAEAPVAMVQMGFLSFSADVLLSVAAVINIIVINSIKFFFEIMVWLIPIPFVDAVLELGNKSICAFLMAIYAWSPLVATLINLLLFAVCAWMFNWVWRRVQLMRTMLTDPLWAMLFPGYAKHTGDWIELFAKESIDPIPAKARIRMTKSDEGWTLTEPRFLLADRKITFASDQFRLEFRQGMFVNLIAIVPISEDSQDNVQNCELYLSRRFNNDLDQLLEKFSITRQQEASAGEVALQI